MINDELSRRTIESTNKTNLQKTTNIILDCILNEPWHIKQETFPILTRSVCQTNIMLAAVSCSHIEKEIRSYRYGE